MILALVLFCSCQKSRQQNSFTSWVLKMLKTCFCLCSFFIVAVFAFLVIILLKLNQMKRLVRLSGPVQRQFPISHGQFPWKMEISLSGPFGWIFPQNRPPRPLFRSQDCWEPKFYFWLSTKKKPIKRSGHTTAISRFFFAFLLFFLFFLKVNFAFSTGPGDRIRVTPNCARTTR